MHLNGVSLGYGVPLQRPCWPEQWETRRLSYPGRTAATATVEGRQLAIGVKALSRKTLLKQWQLEHRIYRKNCCKVGRISWETWLTYFRCSAFLLVLNQVDLIRDCSEG